MLLDRSVARRFGLLCLLLAIALLAASASEASAHGDKRVAKAGILLVAFGTSVPEARGAYDNLDAMVRARFPDVLVRWAYTSKKIRNKLAGRGEDILSPAEALAKMADEDFTDVAVQSLHVMPGEEYHALARTARAFEGLPKGIRRVFVGYPLLGGNDDLAEFARAMLGISPAEQRGGAALVLMGHGTHHPSDVVYPALQYHFWKLDPSVAVGTVAGVPNLDDVRAWLKDNGYTKAVLMPLMAVAGDHARNDMAGDAPDSWKSVLEADGVACEPVLKGIAEYQPLAELWLRRLEAAMAHLE